MRTDKGTSVSFSLSLLISRHIKYLEAVDCVRTRPRVCLQQWRVSVACRDAYRSDLALIGHWCVVGDVADIKG